MERPIFKKTNLEWIVNYDYDRSMCTCDDSICRCTEIERTWINNVNVKEVIEELLHEQNWYTSYFEKYCFDRICYALEIYNKDLYEVETGAGYYGEEVYGVWFDNEKKIFDTFQELLSLNTDIEKIKYCLRLEYGYLLDRIESATSAAIIEVSPDQVAPVQMEHFKKLDRKVIEEYKNRILPVAVCIKDGDRYRLIDGYHRFMANRNKEKVEIIVLE